MANTPWYVGQLAPLWTIQLVLDSGPFNVFGLAPSNFSMVFRNTDMPGIVDIPGTGTFSNITAAVTQTVNGVTTVVTPASVQYQVSLGDVALAANYHVFVKVQMGNGPQIFDCGPWQVLAL